eukprot:6081094-Prymnesium_polylepis.1
MCEKRVSRVLRRASGATTHHRVSSPVPHVRSSTRYRVCTAPSPCSCVDRDEEFSVATGHPLRVWRRRERTARGI